MTLSQDLRFKKNLPGKGKCKDLRRRTFLVVQWLIIRLATQGKTASFPGRKCDSNGPYDKSYDFGVIRDIVTYCSYWSPRVLGPAHHKLLSPYASPNILCATRKDPARSNGDPARSNRDPARSNRDPARSNREPEWFKEDPKQPKKYIGKKEREREKHLLKSKT